MRNDTIAKRKVIVIDLLSITLQGVHQFLALVWIHASGPWGKRAVIGSIAQVRKLRKKWWSLYGSKTRTWQMQAKVSNCQAWSPPATARMPWSLLMDHGPSTHPCQELVQVLCTEGQGCRKTMHVWSWRLCLLFDFILIWLH